MSYSIEEINGCTKKLNFSIESVDLSSQIEVALKKKQKESNLKGFRPGKAPLAMIQKFYGAQVENEALYSFVSKEFFNAVEKEGLSPVAYPSFSNTKFEAEEKKLSFEATVETFPQVKVEGYESYSFEREADKVEDKELDEAIKQVLNSKAEMKPIEKDDEEVKMGHFTVINFEGEKVDGEKPENMKGQEYSLEIGAGQFIPGFEEGLVGMKKGEKRTVEVTFPEDYHAEDLKNAQVKFHVDLLEIKEKHLPELTDELVKDFKFESVDDFHAKTKERIASEKQRKADEKLHQEILDKLVADNRFDIPQSMINQQVEALKKETEASLQQRGFTEQMLKEYQEKWAEDYQTKADFQVRSGLILNKLAEEFKVEAGDEDLENKYEMMGSLYNLGKEEIQKIYGENEQMKKNLLYAVKEEKTFEKLKSVISIKQS